MWSGPFSIRSSLGSDSGSFTGVQDGRVCTDVIQSSDGISIALNLTSSRGRSIRSGNLSIGADSSFSRSSTSRSIFQSEPRTLSSK